MSRLPLIVSPLGRMLLSLVMDILVHVQHKRDMDKQAHLVR